MTESAGESRVYLTESEYLAILGLVNKLADAIETCAVTHGAAVRILARAAGVAVDEVHIDEDARRGMN